MSLVSLGYAPFEILSRVLTVTGETSYFSSKTNPSAFSFFSTKEHSIDKK